MTHGCYQFKYVFSEPGSQFGQHLKPSIRLPKPDTQHHTILHNMYISTPPYVNHRSKYVPSGQLTKKFEKKSRKTRFENSVRLGRKIQSSIASQNQFVFLMSFSKPVYVVLRVFYGFVWFHASFDIRYQVYFQSWWLLCSYFMFSNLYRIGLNNILRNDLENQLKCISKYRIENKVYLNLVIVTISTCLLVP